MAKSQTSASVENDEGAPIPRDRIDPDLVKLRRTRAKVGVITSLGIVVLCGYFLVRLTPDRRFGGEDEAPTAVASADVLEGRVETDRHVEIEAEPLVSHAIRSIKSKGDLGLRLVPARGSSDRLWLALPGDSWDPPVVNSRYTGRLRKLDELPFATAVRGYAAENPRPLFATSSSVRAGITAGKVKTVSGEEIAIADSDRIAFDLVEPAQSTIIASYGERQPTVQAWLAAFTRAGISATEVKVGKPKDSDEALGQVRFDVQLSPAETTQKLAAAELFATRVEPVTLHKEMTWAELKQKQSPDAQVDLIGIYARREIPGDAYVLITGEVPQDYWYVTPISIVLVVIGLLFAWALVRAVRRDLLPPRA